MRGVIISHRKPTPTLNPSHVDEAKKVAEMYSKTRAEKRRTSKEEPVATAKSPLQDEIMDPFGIQFQQIVASDEYRQSLKTAFLEQASDKREDETQFDTRQVEGSYLNEQTLTTSGQKHHKSTDQNRRSRGRQTHASRG